MQPDGCNRSYADLGHIATARLHVTDPVRRSIHVPARPAEVWAALTDPERLRLWFGAEVELEPHPGGDVRARWPNGARSVGSVELAVEPTRLVFRWRRIDGAGIRARIGAATRVTFDVEPSGDGAVVSVAEEPVELASVVGAS
jgi:uncharacterized protein YndB with AHSA1/START domain